jgi:hypothetical protein
VSALFYGRTAAFLGLLTSAAGSLFGLAAAVTGIYGWQTPPPCARSPRPLD